MKKETPWYKKAEMIIGLSALLVSLVAVFVGVYSAYIDRTFSRASMWPSLEIYSTYSSSAKKLVYSIKNVGTGPASIKYTRILYQGQAMSSWRELANKVAPNERFSTVFIGQRTLPTLSSISPFISESPVLSEGLSQNRNDIQIEICYCSVYSECWRVNKGKVASPVAQCEIPDEQRFRD